MADKLALYNAALRRIGERRLASLTEDRPPRHHLDEVYADGFIEELLEHASWNFAVRSVEQTYETDLAPQFGYLRLFAKPSDWVRTVAFCSDEYFQSPINAMADEAGYWACDLDTIYVRYVSSDSEFGGDLGKWTPSFTRWAAVRLAIHVSPIITRGQAVPKTLREEDALLLKNAKAKDALAEGAKFTPPGSWVQARMGGRGFNRRTRENG